MAQVGLRVKTHIHTENMVHVVCALVAFLLAIQPLQGCGDGSLCGSFGTREDCLRPCKEGAHIYQDGVNVPEGHSARTFCESKHERCEECVGIITTTSTEKNGQTTTTIEKTTEKIGYAEREPDPTPPPEDLYRPPPSPAPYR